MANGSERKKLMPVCTASPLERRRRREGRELYEQQEEEKEDVWITFFVRASSINRKERKGENPGGE